MSEQSNAFSDRLTLRPAIPTDTPTLFHLIKSLADYEKLSHEVVGTEEALHIHLFGDRPIIEAILAEWEGEPVGFALVFRNYSLQVAKPGLYLEDLFVLPDYRSQGIGKALLSQLKTLVIERQYHRLDWSVLDWNAPAIAFYQRIGATIDPDLRINRVMGESLSHLAQALSESVIVRPLRSEDVPTLLSWRQSEKNFSATPEQVEADCLGDNPIAEALVLEAAGQLRGGAFFFLSYSTFLTRPGLVIESLICAPDAALEEELQLIQGVARLAVERGCGRLEWWVAIADQERLAAYQRLGIPMMDDWRLCQLSVNAD